MAVRVGPQISPSLDKVIEDDGDTTAYGLQALVSVVPNAFTAKVEGMARHAPSNSATLQEGLPRGGLRQRLHGGRRPVRMLLVCRGFEAERGLGSTPNQKLITRETSVPLVIPTLREVRRLAPRKVANMRGIGGRGIRVRRPRLPLPWIPSVLGNLVRARGDGEGVPLGEGELGEVDKVVLPDLVLPQQDGERVLQQPCMSS